ncbi:Imm1 family immunity protein [Blastopirellula marina]|uniref:Uncharacterized protein n=1 Tax=Blastopirellula marina TaxID=124 RepID=A0A2S8GLM8_9BACT|nr:Imm1 family immunity protein [Blastopirellula marina]PQO45320.1 hypothetical protein C5Y93_15315 [Blastopirellula marina]
MTTDLFVTYLLVDDVRDPPPSQQPDAGVVRSPSWSAITEAIDRLDGEKVRMVVLGESEPDPDTGMPYGGRGLVVGGGGANGLYVCLGGEDDPDALYRLMNNSSPEEQSVEVMCGEVTTYHPRFCVDRSTMLQAVSCFARTGQLDPALTWKCE